MISILSKQQTMKKLLFALALTSIGFCATAQTNVAPSARSAAPGNLFLGVGTGLNATTGIFGLRFDARVSDKVMLGVAAGIGSWGGKISFSGNYQTASGWCPMISISRASGADSIPMALELANGQTKTIAMRLDPVNVITLGVEKQWFTARGNRFYLDLGYAIPTTAGNPFSTVNPFDVISPNSTRAMKFASPGGLVVAFGFALKLS